jgi:starch-binding outer membrane protein, SusD/RagB family
MNKILSFGTLAIAVASLMPMNSCTNLDETLYSQVEESQFFRTEEEVRLAVAGCYTSLYGLLNHGSFFSTQEVNSNEVLIPQRGGDWEDGRQWIKTHLHTQDGTEDCFRNAWTYLFSNVALMNFTIANINAAITRGELTDAEAAPYIAEVRGLRALYYYWLLDSFGNVPLVTDYIVEQNFLPTPNTRAQIYEFVERELREVSPGLTRTVDNTTYSRFTYYAAQALLAKVYLNAETYIGASKWPEALAAANNVVNGNAFSLSTEYFDNFVQDNNVKSKEMILPIPYDATFARGFNLPQMTLHYQSQKTFNLQEQPWNGYCTATDFYNSYEAGDVRLGNFLAGPQFASDGTTQLTDPQAEASDPDGAGVNFTPTVNAIEPNALRQAGARIGKYKFYAGATRDLNNDFPILRYTDILLVKAEALCRIAGDWNNGEARGIVNDIRTRAGVAPYTSMTAETFLAERSRELFYEGWRRQDLIRFGIFNDPRGLRPTASAADRRIWPIPVSQINANPNLSQNRGY